MSRPKTDSLCAVEIVQLLAAMIDNGRLRERFHLAEPVKQVLVQ